MVGHFVTWDHAIFILFEGSILDPTSIMGGFCAKKFAKERRHSSMILLLPYHFYLNSFFYCLGTPPNGVCSRKTRISGAFPLRTFTWRLWCPGQSWREHITWTQFTYTKFEFETQWIGWRIMPMNPQNISAICFTTTCILQGPGGTHLRRRAVRFFRIDQNKPGGYPTCLLPPPLHLLPSDRAREPRRIN